MSGMLVDSKESDWPKEIEEEYERIRPLGEGAFGVVWLAKAKVRCRRDSAASIEDDGSDVDPSEREDTFDSERTDGNNNIKPSEGDSSYPPYVAIKQISAEKDGEKQYAAREIAILSEIHHPNVVRCLRSVEMPRSRLVVLTLANGPDLNELVMAGGALSTSLVRLAARHLISAVAYLHGRGVIHRDVKPDNLILAKTDASIHTQSSSKDDWMANDDFWDDKATFSEKEWKVVLVDFGFAKALTPTEVGMHKSRRTSVKNLVLRGIEKQESQSLNFTTGTEDTNNTPSMKRGGSKSNLRRGASFQRVTRSMSALGTRAFAAPEVTRVRKSVEGDVALTDHVADYGLIADAYSIGCTIKVLLTGIPAEENEMEFMSSQNNVLLNILSVLFSCGKRDGGETKRNKRYKFLDENPKPAREVVMKLTKPVFLERLTVPLARDEPWIKGGMSEDDPAVTLPTGDILADNDDPIKCLHCASTL